MSFWHNAWPLEMFLSVTALISSCCFLFIISSVSFVENRCRPFLIQFCVSLILLSIAHGVKTFDYTISEKSKSGKYIESDLFKFFDLIHEFSYCMESFSLLSFTIERYWNSRNGSKTTYIFYIFVVILLTLNTLVSYYFAISSRSYSDSIVIIPMSLISALDIVSLAILTRLFQNSANRYKKTTGMISLEQRYQISDVYYWSKTLIPVIFVGVIIKLLSLISAWIVMLNEGPVEAFFNFFHENILDAYTIILPYLVVRRHRLLNKKLIRAKLRISPEITIKTLEGKIVNMRGSAHDHFNILHEHWK
ncbi:unnamed protein product [Caenorhabditis angaria]|uniref:Uncharacterized protein n=1 Tax=Caenorhabditis angaria TaxID=860376 RepID=A0A9P1IVN9_9PELO|nr:unnamed protein product [Caenorhabditis angaria]